MREKFYEKKRDSALFFKMVSVAISVIWSSVGIIRGSLIAYKLVPRLLQVFVSDSFIKPFHISPERIYFHSTYS